MTERFERLFQLPTNQYIGGSPVILSAGVLLKDNASGSIVAQLKFQSVSDKRIKGLKVSLSAFDISGTELAGVADYQYLEMDVHDGQEFGANKAIVMPISVTRSFSIKSLVVVFTDGSLWETTESFVVLPDPKFLSATLEGSELQKQYRLATNESAKFSPMESTGLWLCSCGNWNSNSLCPHCRLSKSKAFSAMDVGTLTEQMNIRLEQEHIQQEETAKRHAELQAKEEANRIARQKKIKKIGIVAVVIAVLIGIGSAIYAKTKELTIEKLLAWYTKKDVVSLVGSDDDNDGFYDVKYLGKKFSLIVKYDGDNLNRWSLSYNYPGVDDLDSIMDLPDYKVTEKDRTAAANVLDELLKFYTELFGEPEIFESPVNTTTYTWIVHDRMIELTDYTGNNDLALISAIEIRVNCDHQSFCDHADTTKTKAEATCTEDGYDRTTCNICGYVNETVYEALGHKITTVVTKEPTCSECGETLSTCSVCGVDMTDPIDMIPHTYETVVTKEPSCTEEGINTNTCSVCGIIEEEPIEMVDHSFEESVIKAATCTSAGTREQKCSVCGYSTGTESIAALGHDYGQYAIDEVTCTSNGTQYMKCTNCGDSYEKTIQATGHNWVSATCTQAERCTNCGETVGQPLGHDNSLWDSSYATCTSDGYEQYICDRCSEKTTITIAATGHNYQAIDSSSPTCTQNGRIIYACENGCFETYSEVIPKLGHDFVDGYCTRCSWWAG